MNLQRAKKRIIFVIFYVLSLGVISVEAFYYGLNTMAIFVFVFPILASIMLFKNRFFYFFLFLFDVVLIIGVFLLPSEAEGFLIGLLLSNAGLALVGEYFLHMLNKAEESQNRIKESERKYREIYSLFRTSIDNAPDLIWAKNLNGEYIFANKAMCEKLLCAKDTDEVVGKTDMFFAQRERRSHPENSDWHTFGELCVNSDQRVIETLEPRRFDEYGNVKGEYLHLDVYKSPIWDENGRIIGVFGSGRDVTKEKRQEAEKKKLEEELRSREAFYKEFVETHNQIVIVTDNKAQITYANKAAEKIMGYTREEILKMSPLDNIHPDYAEKVAEVFNKALNGEKIVDFEYMIKHKSGKYLYHTASVFPQTDAQGKIFAFTIFARDDTELKEVHQALIAQNNNMSTILNSLPEFVFIIDENYKIEQSFRVNDKWTVKCLNFFNEEFKNEFQKLAEKSFISGEKITFDFKLNGQNETRYYQAELKSINLSNTEKALLSVSDVTNLIKIKMELEESKFQFKNLLDHTYDWEYWISPENKILYTSPSCEQITGYKPEEFLNDPDLLYRIIVPQDRKLYKEHMRIHKRGKNPGKMQFKISKKNGEMRIIRHTCQGVFDRDGNYLGRRVTNRNATDRFLEEQKAIQAEKKYHEIFDSLLDVYYQVDENSIITMISPSVKELAGYEPEELIGEHASKFYPNFEEYERVRQILVKDKGGNNIELELLTKEGKVKIASLNTKMIIDANGKFRGFQGILRDISELKKALKELEKAKNEAQKYLSIAQAMILVIDVNGKVKLINKKGCEILDHREEDIVGKHWASNFLPPEIREETVSYFNKLKNGEIKAPSEAENEIVTRKGQRRMIKWYNTVLWDEDGKYLGTLSAGVDVTDERRILRQLKESEKELKELNAAKDKFFSIISHDLRSPFTSLLGYTQLAVEEFETSEKEDIKFYIDAIRRISLRIFELIKELLEWSYVQTGKIQIEPRSLAVRNCVYAAVELHADAINKKSLKVQNNVEDKMVAVADESALQTVLRNLLGNAIKFTPPGGKITIDCKSNKNDVILSVSDTGVGIDADDLKKLFKVGENFSRNGTEGEQGTGLGLILCKELVSKMDGDIWAESKINSGSAFFVKLPKKKK